MSRDLPICLKIDRSIHAVEVMVPTSAQHEANTFTISVICYLAYPKF